MEEFHTKTAAETMENFQVSERGLSYSEAKKRLEKNGKNEIQSGKKKSKFVKFLEQFKDVLICVLIVSAIVSLIIGIVEKSTIEMIDAGLIFLVVLFNATFGYFQERKSEQSLEALKNMTKPFCKVMRNSKLVKVKTEDLVVGDIVLLEAGDIVPADLRLSESATLKIDESALTGESIPVEKDASVTLSQETILGERANMAYMGTVVSYGRGSGVVVATGMATEMGKIASALSEKHDDETPLTKRIKRTSVILTGIVIAVCVVVFFVEILEDVNWFSAFSSAVAIAVCAVPEGLPACITVTMSTGVKRMSDQRAIVKRLPAVETLGSTEVICSDKTGTLTLNKMTVTNIFFMDAICEEVNKAKLPDKVKLKNENGVQTLDEVEMANPFLPNRNFQELVGCMLLCNDTKVRFDVDKLDYIGDPTEIALVHYGYLLGVNKEKLEGIFPRVGEVPFDSNRKMMTTIHQTKDEFCCMTKGAVDSVLSRCTRILEDGKIRRITNADKERILAENSRFAEKALRNLAFATRRMEKVGRKTSENIENDLIFLGLVGMIDPPREEVKDAIKTCKKAGITTIMITGDHKDTAFAIAKELGLCTDEKQVITGQQLNEIDDEEFVKIVQNYRVYARVSPEHKVRIVKALKANDKIVAMTGDGVNDAPSIKAADIGVGMGITGTDVTKEAADIVLTDDNFATIVTAVKEGRRIYSTVLKILTFLLGTSFAELFAIAFIALFLGGEALFSPILLLWINFVSDTFVGLAMVYEKPEKDIMEKKPERHTGSLFKGKVGFDIFCSAFFGATMLIVLYCVLTYSFHMPQEVVSTMCFIALSFMEMLHTFNLKSQSRSIFSKNPFDNKVLNWCFLLSACLTVIIVLIPSTTLQSIFGITSLSWQQWLVSLGCALLVIPFFELVKLCEWLFGKAKEKRTKKVVKK